MTTSEELYVIGRVHDAWAEDTDRHVRPDPDLVKPMGEPTQYPEGKVDVSCSAAQEAELQKRIATALRSPSS